MSKTWAGEGLFEYKLIGDYERVSIGEVGPTYATGSTYLYAVTFDDGTVTLGDVDSAQHEDWYATAEAAKESGEKQMIFEKAARDKRAAEREARQNAKTTYSSDEGELADEAAA